MIFSSQLCFKIQQSAGTLDPVAFDFLLRGPQVNAPHLLPTSADHEVLRMPMADTACAGAGGEPAERLAVGGELEPCQGAGGPARAVLQPDGA